MSGMNQLDAATPDGEPTVVSVNISDGGIPKRPVEHAEVESGGIVGDAHDHEKHNTPLQAISLLDLEDISDLKCEGFDVEPGATGENLTVRGLGVDELEIGDRLVLSGGVELRVTKKRKPCYVLDAISPDLKHAIAGRCGAYAEVVAQGVVRPGETITIIR
ncbi:MAG: MOSC domain-containing protein [Planctomycetota bacterium]|jgi:MOSC domain-containing protein YiiM